MSIARIRLSETPFDPAGLARQLDSFKALPQAQLIEGFEQKMREVTGARFALALSSGTAGIHLALKAAGVGPGDLVLVSNFTYVATVNPILYLGAIPIFIDSDEVTWNMDPGLLGEAIHEFTSRGRLPKAILVVHAYGMPANMGRILETANQYRIPVIEDAAEALGSSLQDKKLGTWGVSGVYSFNNNKIVTTYGGGALVTDNQALYENALLWASQSRENKPYYEHRELGYNYRMGPLTAAQGMLGLSLLDQKIASRRSTYERYKSRLSSETCRFLDEPAGYYSNRWLTAIRCLEAKIPQIQAGAAAGGIETRLLWKPMDEQPVFQGFTSKSRGIASQLFRSGITLPSSDHLSDEDLGHISDVIASIIIS
ncbi:MAG: DegT/DnrJ/EryC1/StrS family aminotransferase [Cyclobacteriaceae bacterium]